MKPVSGATGAAGTGIGALQPEQRRALENMGVDGRDHAAFARGEAVGFALPPHRPGAESTLGIVQRTDGGVRSAIVSVHDPGGGILAFTQFRQRSKELAQAFGAAHVELGGCAIVNAQIVAMLERLGFTPATLEIPRSYAGGTIDGLMRKYPVR